MYEEHRPVYRITVELVTPGQPRYESHFLALRAWDAGRSIGPLAFGPDALSRFSTDVRSAAVSLWIASPGQNFQDGPWLAYSQWRRAIAGDLGIPDPGLSEEP